MISSLRAAAAALLLSLLLAAPRAVPAQASLQREYLAALDVLVKADKEDRTAVENARQSARQALVQLVNEEPTGPRTLYMLQVWPTALSLAGYGEETTAEERALLAELIQHPSYRVILGEDALWGENSKKTAFPRLLEIHEDRPSDPVIRAAVISAIDNQWELPHEQRGKLIEDLLISGQLTSSQRRTLEDELKFHNALGRPFDFRFQTIDGEMIDTTEWRGDRILVDYWGVYCGPCIKEMPRMREIHATYGDRGLHIVGFALDRTLARVENYVERVKLPWKIVYPKPSANLSPWAHRVVTQWGITSIPRYILIGPDGTIEARSYYLDDMIEKLEGVYGEEGESEPIDASH